MSSHAVSRRKFLQLASLSAAATALAACVPAAPQQQAVSEQAPASELVTISFMGWGGPEESQAVLDLIERFEGENPGTKVTWLHTPQDYMPKLMSMVAAATPPDTLFTPQDFYKTFCRDGLMLDIQDWLDADPTLSDPNYFLQPQEDRRSAYNGRWHGIGVCWVGQHMFYNVDMFVEAGIEPPTNDPDEAWSWDHFLDVAREFTLDSKGNHPYDSGFDPDDIVQWGVNWRPTGGHFLASVPFMNGVLPLDEDTNKFQFDDPAAVDALQRVADLTNVHYVTPRSSNFDDLGMSVTQMLEGRRVAMHIGGTYELAWTHKIDATLGTACPPKMKQTGAIVVADVRGAMRATKHPEAAYKWVRMTGDPIYQSTFLKIGLWWPNQTALMTPEGLESWISERKSPTEGVHPPGYYDLVDKYVRNHTDSWICPPNFPEADQIIRSSLEGLWNGNQTAEEAVKDAVPRANEILMQGT
jgi:multiple sugar transport system substrate-binding protein